MTDRLLSSLLITALLLLQGLSALHRGSSGLSAGHNPIHNRIFSALETGSTSAIQADDSSPLADIHPDLRKTCDLLDQQLNPSGAMSDLPLVPADCPSPTILSDAMPQRLSRFQQLGPPARGPPPLPL